MNQFKAGDKVRCIQTNWPFVTYGKTYTVVDIACDDYFHITDNDGDRGCYEKSGFELAVDTPTFKVGDKVRVTKAGVTLDPDGMGSGVKWNNSWPGAMNNAVGNVYEVTKPDNGNGRGIRLSYGDYNFPANVLELVDDCNGVDADGVRIKFTDADLKPFQRVVLRSGRKAVVAVDKEGKVGFVFDTGTWCNAEIDCAARFNADYDVMEVYEAPHMRHMLDIGQRGVLVFRVVNFAEQERKRVEADAEVAKASAALKEAQEARAKLD